MKRIFIGFFTLFVINLYAESYENIMKKAKNGDSYYQAEAGSIYEFAKNGKTKNIKKALEWYEKACNNSNSFACNRIARISRDQFNIEKSIKYWIKSNIGSSFLNVGIVYYHGQGVPVDFNKAFKYFNKASHLGNLQATYNLAVMLEKAQGTPHNWNRAWELYVESADMNFISSIEKVKRICNMRKNPKIDPICAKYLK